MAGNSNSKVVGDILEEDTANSTPRKNKEIADLINENLPNAKQKINAWVESTYLQLTKQTTGNTDQLIANALDPFTYLFGDSAFTKGDLEAIRRMLLTPLSDKVYDADPINQNAVGVIAIVLKEIEKKINKFKLA